MAVTKTLGTKAVFKYGLTAGTLPAVSTGFTIELAKSIDFGIQQNTVKTTDNDSSGLWDEYLTGDRGAGPVSVTCHWGSTLADSPNQQLPIAEIAETDGGDLQTFAYLPNGIVGTASTLRMYVFQGFITKVQHNSSHEAVEEITFEIVVSGPVYVSTYAQYTP